MGIIKRLIFITLLFGVFFAEAYQPKEGRVTATLAPMISKTALQAGTGVDVPTLTGVALIANGDVNDTGALEIGMFFTDKIFVRESSGRFVSQKSKLVHMTMGYRYWIIPTLSTSASFYSSYSMGDPSVLHSDFPAGEEIDTSASDITEYGGDLSVQAELWSQGRFGLVADFRYSLSVTAKNNEEGDHYAFLIGLRYFVQEENQRESESKP